MSANRRCRLLESFQEGGASFAEMAASSRYHSRHNEGAPCRESCRVECGAKHEVEQSQRWCRRYWLTQHSTIIQCNVIAESLLLDSNMIVLQMERASQDLSTKRWLTHHPTLIHSIVEAESLLLHESTVIVLCKQRAGRDLTTKTSTALCPP